jgi:hypothetical protein
MPMPDKSKRYPHAAPVETEGMCGAGGGDIDDVGDVGYPRDAVGRDVTRGRGIPEGMGGAGGGDIDDVGEVGELGDLRAGGLVLGGTGDDDMRNTSRSGSGSIAGDTGVVTGITTGVDTDDATEGSSSPLENLDDALHDITDGGTDTPTS